MTCSSSRYSVSTAIHYRNNRKTTLGILSCTMPTPKSLPPHQPPRYAPHPPLTHSPTRYLANAAAPFLAKPLVHGSIFRFEGRLAMFASAKGTGCYRCLFPEPPPPGSVQSCAEAGVFGVLPGIIGSMMAFETIKYLIDIGTPMIGPYLLFGCSPQSGHALFRRSFSSRKLMSS